MSLSAMTPQQVLAFMEGPAGKPPPGVEQNLENPDNLNSTFIILCTVASVVTAFFMMMRFYTRYMLARKFILEDFILFAGWIIFAAGMNTTLYQATNYYMGAHQWDMRVKNLVHFLKLFHQGALLFFVSMLLLRVAILLQILRHFVPKGARNFTFWAAHINLWVNTVFWFAVVMLEVFACSPRNKVFEFYLEGKCIDRHAYLIAAGAMSLASELLIMALPQRVIWKLSLSTKQKLELTPLFLMGILTCICSGIRLWQTIYQWPEDDISYYLADAVLLWTVPEVACCVLVPCLPYLPQFVRLVRGGGKLPSRPSSNMMKQQMGEPGDPRRTTRSYGGGHHHKTHPRTLISDIEYHELVMRTETTVESVEREDTGPWVQPPARVVVQGGDGPRKVFSAPTMFTR